MKVLLVTNFAPDAQESMLRFGRMLATGLAAHGIEASTLSPTPVLSRLARPYRYRGWPKWLGYFDKFIVFPWRLRRAIRIERPDVIHIVDHGNSGYRLAAGSRPLLVTCHDLLEIRAASGEIPLHRPGRSGRLFQRWILGHLSAAADVVCNSQQTRTELLRLGRREPDRTRLLYLGLNHPYAPVPLAEATTRLRRLAPGPWSEESPGYYLNVGGGQWYKNRPGLLRTFAALLQQSSDQPWLVLVGKPLSAADAALVVELGIGRRLLGLANVSNADLAALYSCSLGLIFPSREEGFGWPIAEALACGCPVFTTQRAPMTEVGGDAAVYLDADQPERAAALLLAARADASAMRARGLVQAQRWNPDRMLGDYACVYRQLAAASPSPAP